MIIVALSGGLGNQMFQYAAGRALAERHGTVLKFDLSLVNEKEAHRATAAGHIPRRFELGKLRVIGDVASREDVSKLAGKTDGNLCDRVLFRLRRLVYGDRRYRSPQYGFDVAFQWLPNETHLSGRFAHEAFFSDLSGKLQEELQPKYLNPCAEKLIAELSSDNAIGIHVRRGDYVNNPAFSFIGYQDAAYYRRGYELIVASGANQHAVYVFSDDINWCEDNLDLPSSTQFVSSRYGLSVHEEFEAMKHCTNLVISNSTFSWWTAWLRKSQCGLVVTPEVWIREHGVMAHQCCPKHWLVI